MTTLNLTLFQHLRKWSLVCWLIWPLAGQLQASSLDDPQWPDYQPAGDLSGELVSVGSDSLANLLILWAEVFKTLYPAADLNIQSAGSATAPPALAMGPNHIGPMSRLMNEQEIQEFESQQGYKPVPFAVAIDALAVLVHPDNPLPGLTLEQIDNIFSAGSACGAGSAIRLWGQLGLGADWATQAIELYGRNSISGTYRYFQHHALCDGEFQTGLTEFPGSASLVKALSQSTYGMAYSALGYANDSVRVLPLARSNGQPFVAANQDNAINGSYPLARLLYIYVNHDPAQPWNPLQQEFIRMVLSRQGQEQVVRAGFAALPVAVAVRELQKLGSP
jgi:phosphate transport system substrate-binding protein